MLVSRLRYSHKRSERVYQIRPLINNISVDVCEPGVAVTGANHLRFTRYIV